METTGSTRDGGDADEVVVMDHPESIRNGTLKVESTPQSASGVSTANAAGRHRVCGVFWDIENLQIPHGGNVAHIGQRLLSFAQSYGEVTRCVAVTGSVALNSASRDGLSHVGIDVMHSPVAKEAADKALIVSVLLWLWDSSRANTHSNAPCVICVTADHDFSALVHKIKMRQVYTVLITRLDSVKQTLLGAAHETVDFNKTLLGVDSATAPATPTKVTPTNSAPPSSSKSRGHPSRMCRYGDECKRTRCRFVHPKDLHVVTSAPVSGLGVGPEAREHTEQKTGDDVADILAPGVVEDASQLPGHVHGGDDGLEELHRDICMLFQRSGRWQQLRVSVDLQPNPSISLAASPPAEAVAGFTYRLTISTADIPRLYRRHCGKDLHVAIQNVTNKHGKRKSGWLSGFLRQVPFVVLCDDGQIAVFNGVCTKGSTTEKTSARATEHTFEADDGKKPKKPKSSCCIL